MSASRDFLVEIGTEELPPKSLLTLAAAFADGIAKGLAGAGLAHKSLERFATPRRLAVRVRKLVEQQPDRPLEKRGPPLKAAFDAQGAPTQAAARVRARVAASKSTRSRSSRRRRASGWCIRGTEAGARTVGLLPGIVHGVARRAADRQAHALGRRRRAVRAPGALGADAVRRGRRRYARSSACPRRQRHLRPPLHGAEGAAHREPGRVRRRRCTSAARSWSDIHAAPRHHPPGRGCGRAAARRPSPSSTTRCSTK